MTPPTEYQLKAAVLGKIAKFAEWPAGALPASGPLLIGIFGSDPFGPELETILSSAPIAGRPPQFKRSSSLSELAACHILFVSRTETDRFRQSVGEVLQRPILTIGEESAFLDSGGMVAFVMEGKRVRFDVNLGATERAGITLNSQLLRLARSVRKKGL